MKRSLLTLAGILLVIVAATSAVLAVSDVDETSDGGTVIRSDEGIDPDDCNLVHNITACSEEELARAGIYPRVDQPAPIESVSINIAESFPPQYFVEVQFGLPSGCAKPGGYEVTRGGDRIDVEASITVPAPDVLVACTMIYGYDTYNIALGSDFKSGETYTVDVNGTTTTLTAQ